MESILADMIKAVKIELKNRPEMSNTEIEQWIDEVMQDGVDNRVVSLKDYRSYQANPYGFAVRVLQALGRTV